MLPRFNWLDVLRVRDALLTCYILIYIRVLMNELFVRWPLGEFKSIPFVPKETEANISDGLYIYLVQVWSRFSWETSGRGRSPIRV